MTTKEVTIETQQRFSLTETLKTRNCVTFSKRNSQITRQQKQRNISKSKLIFQAIYIFRQLCSDFNNIWKYLSNYSSKNRHLATGNDFEL